MGALDELVQANPLNEDGAGIDQGDVVAAREMVGCHHARIPGANDNDLGCVHAHTPPLEGPEVTRSRFSRPRAWRVPRLLGHFSYPVAGGIVADSTLRADPTMPIAREGSYLLTHDLAHVTCLGIESAKLAKCISQIASQRIKGVFGNPSFGFKTTQLDFLPQLPWVEVVWFWDVELKNIDGLYSLSELRHFGIHPKRPAIDFSRFPKLQKLVLFPQPGDSGFRRLEQLTEMHLWHYKPKGKDFSLLELPTSLTHLVINWANAESLETLPKLSKIRRLEVHRCRNLTSLGALSQKFPKLEHLVVDACPRVTRDEGERAIHGLSRLSHAFIANNKLV